jgi:hypothetical protein
MMVATELRFHRDMLDGKHIASKALKFHLVPDHQVVTSAPLRLMKFGAIKAKRNPQKPSHDMHSPSAPGLSGRRVVLLQSGLLYRFPEIRRRAFIDLL